MTTDKPKFWHGGYISNFAYPSALSARFLLVLEEQDGRFAGVVRIVEETFEAAIVGAFNHIEADLDITAATIYRISHERYMDVKEYRRYIKEMGKDAETEAAERRLYELLKEKYG